MRIRSVVALAVLAVFGAFSSALADARTYVVTEGGGSRVQFTSDAPLERMTGTSTGVSGEFTADPTNLAATRGTIDVRIASIRTGIDLRDEHLRSSTWLDAGRFPVARFELTGVSGATGITPGHETRVSLRGTFALHGQRRAVTAEARILWEAHPDGSGGDRVRIRARFRIRLTDYGVSVPAIVELKVSNDIVIDVSLVATQRR